MNRKNMRLLFLGDENVGKSSLIHTIYSEVSSNVEKTLKKVILPPEMCLYSKEVFTELVDTSVDMDLTADIHASDLVLLVYDVSDPDTIARIETDWLPRINAVNPKTPVILVGNKIDKKQLQFQSENQYIKIKDILKKVTKRYKNVQMGIECSAFYDRNVKSVLNCAQRAVLYPLSPLYNLQQKKITPDFRKALIRIFRILDQDMDGKLHDSEMNVLQQRVFHSELNVEDIKAIKQIILRELEVEQQDYIQLKGFIALQKKCIQMLKIQICWSILRYFNYDDKLRLKTAHNYFVLDQQVGQSVQLSSDAINFLIKIYSVAKKNIWSMSDSKAEEHKQKRILQYIFQSCPQIQFPEFASLDDMSESKFLTSWCLYAFVDYKKCYQDLLYLGCEQSIDETFVRQKCKKSYRQFQKLKDNRVFSILIVDSKEYKSYIDPLFSDGQKIEVNNLKNQNFTYHRNSRLFTNQNIAKTFLLFKVKKRDLPLFYSSQTDSETLFAKKIDLILQFDSASIGSQQKVDIRSLVPDYALYKIITKQQATQILHTHEPVRLDLQSMPVRYDQQSYAALFSEVAYRTIQNIEQGLSRQKIEQLKQESKQKKNMILLSSTAVAISALVLGHFLFKKYQARLLN